MVKFISLSLVERGAYNEDTGLYDEGSKPVIVNATCIRCFYARRDGKPGTRITFADGGGFAVIEAPDAVAALVAPGEAHGFTAPVAN